MSKNLLLLFIVIIISIYIANSWDSLPLIKNSVNSVLNPTLGYILNWNVYIGFLLIVALTSFILTLTQKYLSDQDKLREIRKEQKLLQEEMKKYRDNPEKLMEFQKKQLEILPKTMELTMKPLLYTSIPIILFFRWFGDYLTPIFGLWWILYYLIGAMIFSYFFRKVLNVV